MSKQNPIEAITWIPNASNSNDAMSQVTNLLGHCKISNQDKDIHNRYKSLNAQHYE
jgi:hypothetical protein